MERLILQRLLKWKHSPYRKPLILKGVRQARKNVGPQGAGFLSSPTVHKSGEGRFLLRFWCLLIGIC